MRRLQPKRQPLQIDNFMVGPMTNRLRTAHDALAPFSTNVLSVHAGPLSPVALARLQSHPRFAEAARTAMANHVAIKRKRPMVIADFGRLTIGNLALYLHFTRDPDIAQSGLTVSRLRALCADQEVCSSGRTLSVVALMRRYGYLTLAASRAVQPQRELVPTERLIQVCTQYWEASLLPAALVADAPSYDTAALQRADVLAAFMRISGDCFCAGVRMLQRNSVLAQFAHRNAGMTLLFHLLIASDVEGQGGSPAPAFISLAKLARQCAVSRAQVLRLLDDATRAGLIERSRSEPLCVTLQPQLSDSVQHLFAVTFSLCDYYMRTALELADKR
jgi:hypothetical protein